ncbi:hypothetical protein RUND412_010103 [Rhizina undulata]
MAALIEDPGEVNNNGLISILLSELFNTTSGLAYNGSISSSLAYLAAEESFLESLSSALTKDQEALYVSKEQCAANQAMIGGGFFATD